MSVQTEMAASKDTDSVSAGNPKSGNESSSNNQTDHGGFTGKLLLTVFVSDVKKSAAFYRYVLGFNFLGFYDYDLQGYVDEWNSPKPPIYAGFTAGDQKFGLHKPMNDYQETCVGKGRCYFEINDLDAHYERILESDVKPGPIKDTAHLKRFRVIDPDGRYIYFAVTQKDAPTYPW